MPDPSVLSLATEPSARVMVFVDGQNLYQASKRIFGRPHCHPHLLAEHLAGQRTLHHPSCRFYTGRPNPDLNPDEAKKARNLDRRLAVIRRSGVTVITRPLRYHWDWAHREQLPRPCAGAEDQQVTLRPWQRPQEKGIDLALGLEVIEFALTDRCDVAIVVSLDRDLKEIAVALKNLKHLISRPIRIEAAVPVESGGRKTLDDFDYTHQITPDVFHLVQDDTDYTVQPDLWKPPIPPANLAEAVRLRLGAGKLR
jgi:uncharacterized LabA/DUF88 family protein